MDFLGDLPSFPIGLDTLVNGVPRVVPIAIDWSVYALTEAISPEGYGEIGVNLVYGDPAQRLDKIRSMRIDNKASRNTVYVTLPDTGQVLVCPPGELVESVITNVLNFKVGIDNLYPGSMPKTVLEVLNINRAGYFVPLENVGVVGSYIGKTAKTLINPSPTILGPINTGPVGGDRINIVGLWLEPTSGAGVTSITSIATGKVLTLIASRGSNPATSLLAMGYYVNDSNLLSDSYSVAISGAPSQSQIFVWSIYNMRSRQPYFKEGIVTSATPSFRPYTPNGSFVAALSYAGGSTQVAGLTMDALGSGNDAVAGHRSIQADGVSLIGPFVSNVVGIVAFR